MFYRLRMKLGISIIFITSILFLNNRMICQQLAFPGAEGAGKYTVGGRGGKVYIVTNLNDDGPGSLREAVKAKGARTVVFNISGTIILNSDLSIKNDSITIAGQTAPGDGICIRKYQLVVEANQVIIRYIRVRLGSESGKETDAMGGRYKKNIIIDHCSVSWSVDETMSFYDNENSSFQWCLISESLYMSNHAKGAHGYGGIWGGKGVSFHHNLFAHHSSRNPRFSGGDPVSGTPASKNLDFRNNVIYNWGFNSAYGGEQGTINMVANYFKPGPATKNSVKKRIVEPLDSLGRWYIDSNYIEGFSDVSANNWSGGVQGSFAKISSIRVLSPFPYIPIPVQTAQEAYTDVLNLAGAVLPKRDPVDARIIYEVRSGTATYKSSSYAIKQGLDTNLITGIIDNASDVGGWPVLNSLPPLLDSDKDGMPDDWEISKGLNPLDPNDRNNYNSEGYTRLEEYLYSFNPVVKVESLLSDEVKPFVLNQNYPNPFNPLTNFSFYINKPGRVTLKIYNSIGQLIKIIADKVFGAGCHTIFWDAKDIDNKFVPTGTYFVHMTYMEKSKSLKINFIK